MELRNDFLAVPRDDREGTVEAFEQKITCEQVKKATLVITALGLYEVEINGNKVGDVLFAPGFTYYPSHLYCQSYDVTQMLTGNDTLTVYLAQGWYCGRFTFDNKVHIYGEKPAVSWILVFEDNLGTHTYASDDESVKAVASPYEYAGFYDGEIYNKNREQEIIQPVKYAGNVPEIIEEGTMCVRIREEMPVRNVNKRVDVTILDFGQNFAGIIEIDPSKMSCDCLKLRHGEILNADGSLYTTNLRKAKAETIYHKGQCIYRPRFTYMGFRYVELSGVEYEDGLLTA